MIPHVLALFMLLAVTWVPIQLLAVPVAPRIRASIAMLVVVYVSVVVWVAIAAPALLAPLAIIVTAGFIYAHWRARPFHGRRQGLPPGSLGLHSSLQALTDYHFYEKQASLHGPIFKTNQYYRPVVCVVGLSLSRELLRLHHDRLTSAPLPVNRHITGGFLRYMEPHQHKVYRKVMQSCMTQQAIRDSEPFVTKQTRLALSRMATGAMQNPTTGVRPYEYIDRITSVACARIFFGFESEESISTLMNHYDVIDPRSFWRSGVTRRALRAIALTVREQAERMLRQPEATPNCFLAEAVRNDARIGEDPIFIDNLAYFLLGARLDVRGLLAWLVKMLCDHSEWGLRLRSERIRPGRDRANPLADRFVSETLRLYQSEYLYRTSSERIQFEGFNIPRGWLVRMCIHESHASDEVFEAPRRFNPDRFLDRVYSQDEYQPFGAYEHSHVSASS